MGRVTVEVVGPFVVNAGNREAESGTGSNHTENHSRLVGSMSSDERISGNGEYDQHRYRDSDEDERNLFALVYVGRTVFVNDDMTRPRCDHKSSVVVTTGQIAAVVPFGRPNTVNRAIGQVAGYRRTVSALSIAHRVAVPTRFIFHTCRRVCTVDYRVGDVARYGGKRDEYGNGGKCALRSVRCHGVIVASVPFDVQCVCMWHMDRAQHRAQCGGMARGKAQGTQGAAHTQGTHRTALRCTGCTGH